jgi:transposase
MDRNALELLLAGGNSVEEIGRRLGKHPSTVAYWMDKHGLKAVNREKHADRGGIQRERLEQLVDAGMTIAEIAAHVDRSKATVRHWLLRYRLRTLKAQRAEQQRAAREAGLLTVELTCSVHGAGDFVLSRDGYYRCRRCRVESVVRRRRKVKELLVSDAGGGCCICGYDRFVGALEFHHVDPDDKRMALSGAGVTLALEVLLAESLKCVLLCSNCHAEVEGGVTLLPARVAEAALDCRRHRKEEHQYTAG